jgi:hypothetical protein
MMFSLETMNTSSCYGSSFKGLSLVPVQQRFFDCDFVEIGPFYQHNYCLIITLFYKDS